MKYQSYNIKARVVYEICENSSFVLFVTEFFYHMYRKNAFLNGKQKQMKPLLVSINILVGQNSETNKYQGLTVHHR